MRQPSWDFATAFHREQIQDRRWRERLLQVAAAKFPVQPDERDCLLQAVYNEERFTGPESAVKHRYQLSVTVERHFALHQFRLDLRYRPATDEFRCTNCDWLWSPTKELPFEDWSGSGPAVPLLTRLDSRDIGLLFSKLKGRSTFSPARSKPSRNLPSRNLVDTPLK